MLQKIQIKSILGGKMPTDYFGSGGQFYGSSSIDPEMPSTDSSFRASGVLRPTSMEDFSGANVNDAISCLITNPKDTKLYSYLTNGKLISYNSSLASETLETTITTSTGNGGAYYDNYLYLAKNTDIARFGRLDGTPTVTQDYWTSTLSLAALTNTTYPTIQGEVMPNHVMHRHTDNALYICDVQAGKGVLHKIKTTKTTNEGDTNNGSAASAVDFGYGYYPTTLTSLDTQIVVGLIEGASGTTINQKPFSIAIWDTTSNSFTSLAQSEFNDPLVTAIINDNGVIKVFSGDTSYTRVSRLLSNYTLEEIQFIDGTPPPLHYAIDKMGSRLAWGSNITAPDNTACVWAIGAKNRNIPMGLHNILNVQETGSILNTTAIKYIQVGQNEKLQPICAWRSSTDTGINKLATTYKTCVFESEVFNIGQPFTIKRIYIPTEQAIAANMTITPKVLVDNQKTTFTLNTINSTNYPNSEQLCEIVKSNKAPKGKQNFFLQLIWSGTALLTVTLPITIYIEIEEPTVI